MTIPYPRAVFVYESKEIRQFFMCPDCLEFIEGDMCLNCGQLYNISTESKDDSSFHKANLITNSYGVSI